MGPTMAGTRDWISVGDLGTAFKPEANLLPPTPELAGTCLRLSCEDGRELECAFLTASELTFTTRGGVSGASASSAYRASQMRPGIYFVDFVLREERASTISLVLDLQRGIFTAVQGQLPTQEQVRQSLLERIASGEELTSVRAMWLSGAIDRAFTADTPRHGHTTALVGRRIEYTYSPTERYEHIYLNDRLYTWHCLEGSERGLADTDRCDYREIAPDLFLFAWREKIVPTLGIVMVDLQRMKTTGKILGYRDFTVGEITNFPVGARVRLLDRT